MDVYSISCTVITKWLHHCIICEWRYYCITCAKIAQHGLAGQNNDQLVRVTILLTDLEINK